jgi:ribonuclease III
MTPESAHEKLNEAERILGHTFSNRDILLAAITHPSATEDAPFAVSYERLEFLGDAVLGAIVSEELYTQFPFLDEGGLTRIKVSLVSGTALASIAEELGFENIIITGASVKSLQGRARSSIFENVFEALVAALFLEAGMEAAKNWVLDKLRPHIDVTMALKPESPKSSLQEVLQEKHVTPHYRIIDRSGPAHSPMFKAEVLSGETVIGVGEGHSKKEAEAEAARVALESINKPKSKRKRSRSAKNADEKQ